MGNDNLPCDVFYHTYHTKGLVLFNMDYQCGMYYVGSWNIYQYERLTECQDSLLRDYCRIIELQSNRIKELENELKETK